MVWLSFINVSSITLPLSWTNYKVDEEDITLYSNHKVLKSLGLYQAKIYGSTNFDTSKLAVEVPCSHKCIFTSSRCNVST
jgi:hypothetical protein